MKSLYNSGTGGKAARIIVSQNGFFSLVEREVGRLAAEAPQFSLKHKKLERAYPFYNKVELTVECSGRVNLDIEVNRPGGESISGVQCMVGVFQKNRHQNDTKLEDHVFLPTVTEQGVVLWADRNGAYYTPQQLCEFAFRRFFAYFGRC
jgi:hypothetical protein